MRPSLSRREALIGALSLPLLVAGCTGDTEQAVADPDRDALESALDVETALSNTIGVLRVPADAARQARYAVDAHVKALDDALGQLPSVTAEPTPAGTSSATPSASPSGSSSVPSKTTLPEAIGAADRATDAHTKALRTASASISPLIASIAASDAAIAALLRGGTV